MNEIGAFAMRWHIKRLDEASAALNAVPPEARGAWWPVVTARVDLVRDDLMFAAIGPVAVEQERTDV